MWHIVKRAPHVMAWRPLAVTCLTWLHVLTTILMLHRCQQDVPGREVAMHDVAGVHVFHATCHIQGHLPQHVKGVKRGRKADNAAETSRGRQLLHFLDSSPRPVMNTATHLAPKDPAHFLLRGLDVAVWRFLDVSLRSVKRPIKNNIPVPVSLANSKQTGGPLFMKTESGQVETEGGPIRFCLRLDYPAFHLVLPIYRRSPLT